MRLRYFAPPNPKPAGLVPDARPMRPAAPAWFLRFLAATLVLSTCAASTASAELIFNFSFGTVETLGPIEGIIFGLMDNVSDQPATEVQLTSIGDHDPPFSVPFNIIAAGWAANPNSFTVENGEITAWNAFFASGTNREALDLGANGLYGPAFETNRGLATEQVTSAAVDEISFTQPSASIPEPTSLALLALASGAAAALRWRKRC